MTCISRDKRDSRTSREKTLQCSNRLQMHSIQENRRDYGSLRADQRRSSEEDRKWMRMQLWDDEDGWGCCRDETALCLFGCQLQEPKSCCCTAMGCGLVSAVDLLSSPSHVIRALPSPLHQLAVRGSHMFCQVFP